MELHNLKRGTKFKLADGEVGVPPGAPMGIEGRIYEMGNLDGMYCNGTDTETGERVYFAAWSQVEVVE